MTTQNDRNAAAADSLIDRRNTLALLAGQADAMAAPAEEIALHKISDGLSVTSSDGATILYDTGARRPRIIVELDDGEMCGLIEWYMDGLCPVCFTEIPDGEVLCDKCNEKAHSRCAYGPPLFPDDTLIGPEPKVPYRLPKAAK